MEKQTQQNVQEPDTSLPTLDTTRKPGGLYRHVKMSVKSANILVIVLSLILVFAMLFLANHNGFTVKFDTDGGSHIESCKVLHAETIPPPTPPVKEGYVFTGWYRDRACTIPWNLETDTATESMTLYAGWIPKS